MKDVITAAAFFVINSRIIRIISTLQLHYHLPVLFHLTKNSHYSISAIKARKVVPVEPIKWIANQPQQCYSYHFMALLCCCYKFSCRNFDTYKRLMSHIKNRLKPCFSLKKPRLPLRPAKSDPSLLNL